jgi:hypothetical protein
MGLPIGQGEIMASPETAPATLICGDCDRWVITEASKAASRNLLGRPEYHVRQCLIDGNVCMAENVCPHKP